MKTATAGALGGLVAGAITAGVTLIGHDTGLLHKRLSPQTQAWLNRNFVTNSPLAGQGGQGGELVEQVGHYAASAGLGSTYGAMRPFAPFLPGVICGALFGAGAYALGVVGVLPELGVGHGARREGRDLSGERFGVHVLFGAILGAVTDALSDRRR